MRVGLTPTPWSRSSESGSSVAATRNGAAEEKSPGTSMSSGARRLRRPDAGRERPARDTGPGSLQHALGVVAARGRLDHRRRAAVRIEPRQEHARLDLCARHRRLVADRLQRPALDPERCVAIRRLDRGAHLPQRRRRPARAAAGTGTRRRRARSVPSAPASRPGSRRMRVPAFPQSMGLRGGPSPRSPTPPTRITSFSSLTAAPSAATACTVDSVSAERPNPRISLSPSATAPSRTARWEIDLSPGTPRSPRTLTAGSTLTPLAAWRVTGVISLSSNSAATMTE